VKKVTEVILVQPPFVQLNGPYPAPYYLKSFLSRMEMRVTVLDHSIGLFEKIFSRAGLERIFADASSFPPCNKNTLYFIERFLSERELWLACIDRAVAFLRGRDPEWGHFLTLANGCLPGGPRSDVFLAERDGDISADDAKIYATKLLEDLTDFITVTLDSGFSLIRYTPVLEGSLASGFRDFAAVQKSLDGYIMNTFYRPMLNDEWTRLDGNGITAPFVLGITVPFPGCLASSLVCAESAKRHFGPAVRTVVGGGYVNTELRFLNTPEFFDYFDYVSFDRGYGSLASILDHIEVNTEAVDKNGRLYKTMYRRGGKIIAPEEGKSVPAEKLEDEAVRTVFPDYVAVDFSRYLYPVDDVNPMHRLWSDGHWLKAYLAYGCYWHACAFCDVTLDYIRSFAPVDPAALFDHLKSQAEKTGIHGVHLCDEAAPVSSLLEFALLNREAGLPLNFWGNIRYEGKFDPDTAAILAAGGLTAVSAGLEVATEKGFKRLGKGIDTESAVRACASFQEAGILTHAYLIFGYWDEDEQEIIDSAEILRQFFERGLLNSAFWHKFILTRHSRIYAEKQRGRHPGLVITEWNGGQDGGMFALNDLSFEGEEKYDKYSGPLDLLLSEWMAGKTDTAVQAAFPFRVKEPTVPPDFVFSLLDKYARERDLARAAPPADNVIFLGSIPRLWREGKDVFLLWRWRLADRKLRTGSRAEAEKLAALLETASRGRGSDALQFYAALEEISGDTAAKKIWKKLRESGLTVYRRTDGTCNGNIHLW